MSGVRFDESHSHISTPSWVRNYKGGAGEYERLAEAIALNREAALKSASWGMFQILGVIPTRIEKDSRGGFPNRS